MKAKELREMGEDGLEEKLLEFKKELSKQRGTISSGTKPESPGKIKKMRRDIARIITIMNEKQKTKPTIQAKENKAEEAAMIGEKKKFEIKKITQKKEEKSMPKKENKTSYKKKMKKLIKAKKTGGKKKK